MPRPARLKRYRISGSMLNQLLYILEEASREFGEAAEYCSLDEEIVGLNEREAAARRLYRALCRLPEV